MIKYALRCADGHSFESWFQSADAFDRLHRSAMVECAICGVTDVSKELMAPQVAARPLSGPPSAAEQAFSALRRKVEENSEYVGRRFAEEARAIHDGTSPERAIHGEARADEARKLVEDGVPVLPLPFGPIRKAN